MEQFFRAAQVADEEKVSITGMYLMGDAKLWWRTRLEGDAESGRPQISTWEILKRELKEQFLPTNAAWLARESLRRLKQTRTVQDYVKEFSSLMLDIKNMSEEDKLFNFVSGLQAWAQTELRRQGVKDLPTAMATADCLVDYKLLGTMVAGQKPKMEGSRKQKVTGKPFPNQTKGKKEGNAANLRAGESQNGQQTSKSSGCFICQGPHRARDCPRMENVFALQTTRKEEQDSDSDDSTPQLNRLQLVNTFHKPNLVNKLMYVLVQVNGAVVRAMVDTGATECCLSNSIAAAVGLTVEPYASVVVPLNGEDHRVNGIARAVPFQMGDWTGHCDFMVMYLRDF